MHVLTGILSFLLGSGSLLLYFYFRLKTKVALPETEEQLRHMAYHDALTGLLNRNKLEEEMKKILLLSDREQLGFAVIFLDLDHFKNIIQRLLVRWGKQ